MKQSLATLTSKIGSGATPRGGASVYQSDGIALIRSQNVHDWTMKRDGLAHITDSAANLLAGVTVHKGDVLINITGDSIARCCVVDPCFLPARVNQHVAIIRPSPGLVPGFLAAVLINPEMKSRLLSDSAGGTRNALTKKYLEHLQIDIPSVSTQRAIAQVLGALDDKIAANTALARTADELVRMDYERLGQSTSQTVPLGQLIGLSRDLVDPRVIAGDFVYVGLEHVPRRLMWLSEFGRASDATSTKGAFQTGDILFGKLRPYFHKVVIAPTSGICSTDILVCRTIRPELQGFCLAATASDEVVARTSAATEGTRMPRTNWRDLAAIQIPWPGDSAALAFGGRVQTLRWSVESSLSENHTLAELRDTLLPQLMSGKLRVKDAERQVESVA